MSPLRLIFRRWNATQPGSGLMTWLSLKPSTFYLYTVLCCVGNMFWIVCCIMKFLLINLDKFLCKVCFCFCVYSVQSLVKIRKPVYKQPCNLHFYHLLLSLGNLLCQNILSTVIFVGYSKLLSWLHPMYTFSFYSAFN